MNCTMECWDYNYTTHYLNGNTEAYICTKCIILPVISFTCCIGLTLNGIIWLLGFQMKRNPFTVLILNLAIADLGVLIFMPILAIRYFEVLQLSIISNLVIFCLSDMFYLNGLFLLATISIDRCVSVFFPIWHHCSRPKCLSPAVLIQNIMEYMDPYSNISSLHLVVTAMLCFPLIIISTVILFIKIYMKPEQAKRRRLLVMILITLVCFLILTFPLYVYIVTAHFLHLGYIWDIFQFPSYFYLSACVNSSINPVIYFLVGRKKRAQSKENIKVIFQRVFQDDEAPETRQKFTNRVSNSF
uniref:G-protein coupled receptors family 1 profile domain-containing protein n=1 Tax=Naja naja TaxID=35670 RepID=A0A8C6YGF0_NAJNA